jgi:hypothetical protein
MAGISSVYIFEREPFIRFDDELGLYEYVLTKKQKGVERVFYPGGFFIDSERPAQVIDFLEGKIMLFGGRPISDLLDDIDRAIAKGATNIIIHPTTPEVDAKKTFVAVRWRDETPEEYEVRQKHVQKQKSKLEETRRAAYEALKAEFELK